MDHITLHQAGSIDTLMGGLSGNRLSFKFNSRPASADGLASARKAYDGWAEIACRTLTVEQIHGLLLVCQAAIDGHNDRPGLDVEGRILDDAIEALERAMSPELAREAA